MHTLRVIVVSSHVVRFVTVYFLYLERYIYKINFVRCEQNTGMTNRLIVYASVFYRVNCVQGKAQDIDLINSVNTRLPNVSLTVSKTVKGNSYS